jgi:hypothetical protein
MEQRFDSRPARDRGSLASEWVQGVLGVAFASALSPRQEVRNQGIVQADLPHGCGERRHVSEAAEVRQTSQYLGVTANVTILFRYCHWAPSPDMSRSEAATRLTLDCVEPMPRQSSMEWSGCHGHKDSCTLSSLTTFCGHICFNFRVVQDSNSYSSSGPERASYVTTLHLQDRSISLR